MTAITDPTGASGYEDTRALIVDDLNVTMKRSGTAVQITDSVSFNVNPGEAVAIVGESGSGKSITAKAILDLLPHGLTVTGAVTVTGNRVDRMSTASKQRMRGSDIALVMQDPFTMLNPMVRCGEQVTAGLTNAAGRPLRGAVRQAEAVRRLAEVGISDPAVAKRYPFELSGGMLQRVGIAAAIAKNPKVLIADEPTTALDVTTQKEILELLKRLRDSHRLGLILITHDLRVAFSVCDRVYVMYAGEVVETAAAPVILASPSHPYTANLLLADPPLDRRVATLANIPGSVPAPGNRPVGCHFAERCEWVTEACRAAPIDLLPVDGSDHRSRCIRTAEIAGEIAALDTRRAETVTAVEPPPQTEEPVIFTRDARREFGPKVAVVGATIEIHRGESVGLVGESGSGKTTTARMLVGLTTPTSGLVSVGGIDLGAKMGKEAWGDVRSTVQMVFQDPFSTLNPHRKIGSTLRDSLRMVDPRNLGARAGELLELVGLPPTYVNRLPTQLSGGERQRVAIARALARKPDVVVCDEVVSALDVSVQAHILNLLRRLQSELGLGYVFITHDLAVVRQITDRVYVLKDGEVVESGPTGRVLDQPEHPYTRRLLQSVPTLKESSMK
ncbi:dipeptide ABC transporter ATP-binding protein [Microbacterium tumbae]